VVDLGGIMQALRHRKAFFYLTPRTGVVETK